MALLSTTAGWFPKPAALLRARWQHAEGDLDAAGLARAEAAARAEAVALQRRVGLGRLVDGQLERADPVGDAAGRIAGVEAAGLVRCFGNRYFRRPRIVGDVSPADLAAIVAPWREARELAGDDTVRAIVTGPYSLMDGSFDEHYRSRGACVLALAGVVRAEVEALLEAGAAEIQLDEPLLGGRPDEMGLAREALAEAVAPARGRARVWVQVAHAWLEPVIAELVRFPGDGLMLELSHAPEAVLEALGSLPEDKQLAAGVIDVIDPRIEETAEVRTRLAAVLRRVPAERVVAAPDGPLRALSSDVAERKLERLVAAAASL